MRRLIQAIAWTEGPWHIAQCLNYDIASQGNTEEEALTNLKEALKLAFLEPLDTSTHKPIPACNHGPRKHKAKNLEIDC